MKKSVKVKYTGPFADYSGYGEANRNAIKSLHEAGVKVTTEKKSYSEKEVDYGESYDLAKSLEGEFGDYDIKIIHVPSDGYLKFLEPTKYHIGHLFWETDSMSDTWVWNCNRVDEIWTGGEVHKENFRKSGVKVPIFVFPQAIDIEPVAQEPLKLKGHEGLLFYSIFQWIERKNPRALLESYWREFQGHEDVSLLLKVYRFGFSKKEKDAIRSDIKKWKLESGLKDFPRVFLYLDLLTKKDLMRIHLTGDCFVSAHRGEGWGIPQAEAAVYSNPIISTNLGGVHEWFEDRKSAHLVKWDKTKVFNMEFAPWYERGQHWAEVDQGDLRRRMRDVYTNREKAMRMGEQARLVAEKKLSYKAVGELMRDRLEQIQRTL